MPFDGHFVIAIADDSDLAAVVPGVLLEHQHDITITEIRIHTVTADMHSAEILRLAALEIGVGNFDHFLF